MSPTSLRARPMLARAVAVVVVEKLENRALFAVPALLDPLTQPKFVNPVFVPPVAQPTVPGGNDYAIGVTQFQQNLGLVNPATGQPMLTTVWGYGGSYPGPTFVTQKDTPTNVTWTNNLVTNKNKPLPHLLGIDTSIHHAFTGTNYTFDRNGIPIATHLHGGHTEAASDGTPHQWFTPGFKLTGADWAKKTLTYANDQEAATLWYHDHAMGITRLNVYAGLAGFYLLRDNIDTGVADNPATPQNENPLGLPTGQYEAGLAIQDKVFTADGQLYFPTDQTPGMPVNSILPEMFGDTILVNGVAWPYMNVEPRKYRFHLLNGADSRFFNFTLPGGQTFTQVGSDQGLLPAPVTLNQLTLGPGERADVIVDFAGLNGQTIVMKNNAKTPFPNGATVDPRTTGQIMAFKVGNTVTTPEEPLNLAALSAVSPLVPNVAPRKVALFEMMDQYGRMLPSLGTPDTGAKMFHDPATEIQKLGDKQVWEIYNTTPDAHPIHLHLVKFQVLSRQGFTAATDPVTGVMSNIRVKGNARAVGLNETGWKDTVVVNPGEVVRIIAHFDKVGAYVWHCHILSHEEHDMMRPLLVLDPNGGSTPVQLLDDTAIVSTVKAKATFSQNLIGDSRKELLATL